MREYDLTAESFAADRRQTIGVPEVTALAASLPQGARVLDVGCGNGLPITRTLLDAGHRVVGLDSSSQMLARFRAHDEWVTFPYFSFSGETYKKLLRENGFTMLNVHKDRRENTHYLTQKSV
jgi:ubiquinone/menaquinone biosynthesis C-methylase UbiE